MADNPFSILRKALKVAPDEGPQLKATRTYDEPKTKKSRQVYSCPDHGVWKPPFPPKHDCTPCWSLYGRWRYQLDQQAKRSGRPISRKQGRGSKEKGRAGVVTVVELLLRMAPWLDPGDIYVKATSQLGADVHLSPAAQRWLNYALEVKNTERLDMWGALRQAEANAKTCPALLFFKRAHSELYVALKAEEFLKLLPCPPNDRSPRNPPTP